MAVSRGPTDGGESQVQPAVRAVGSTVSPSDGQWEKQGVRPVPGFAGPIRLPRFSP
jgi:hypothetical protein